MCPVYMLITRYISTRRAYLHDICQHDFVSKVLAGIASQGQALPYFTMPTPDVHVVWVSGLMPSRVGLHDTQLEEQPEVNPADPNFSKQTNPEWCHGPSTGP